MGIQYFLLKSAKIDQFYYFLENILNSLIFSESFLAIKLKKHQKTSKNILFLAVFVKKVFENLRDFNKFSLFAIFIEI